jgi:hypothetical protein
VQVRERSGSARRLVRLLAVVGAALPALAVAPAAAQTAPGARDVRAACSHASQSAFVDRPPERIGDAVDCLASYGVTAGATPTAYEPSLAVTRGQMASFLIRMGEVAGRTVPDPGSGVFPDDDGSVHEGAIGRLTAWGVASGHPDGTFRPLLDVTRGQMATLIARQLRLLTGGQIVASASDHFSDDDGTTHEAAIDELAEIGIVTGVEDGTYDPAAPVTRAQMALFITRSLDWLTEDRGAGLARIGVTDATGSPELVTATSTSSGGVATVAFAFDEEVSATTIVPDGFSVLTFDGQPVVATSATRDPTSADVVLATFPSADERLATTASTRRDVVQDLDGNPAPEGAVPLRALSLLAGTTTAPDLFGVSRLGATTVDLSFDERAFVVAPTGYHLVLADGTTLDSTGATGNGTPSHNVTFPTLTAEQSATVVRAYVDRGTVSDAEQTAGGGVEGDVNPQQAVVVTAGGSLVGVPDLTAVSVDVGSDTARLTFDEAVDLVGGSPGRPPFRLYDLQGFEISSDRAAEVADDDRTVVVAFDAGARRPFPSGVSVDAGAVSSTATGATNRVDEEGLAVTFGAGETAAPDLVRTGRQQGDDPATTVRRVVFEFDQRISLRSAGGFAVYGPTGARSELTGCATTDERSVTCSVDPVGDPLLHAAIGEAALAGALPATVVDLRSGVPSHARARPL